MQKVFNVLLLLGMSVCVLINADIQEKKQITEKRLEKIDEMCKEILMYTQAGNSPMDANFPLAKKIIHWSAEVQQFSDEEKQELALTAHKIIERSSAECFKRYITRRQGINFSLAVEAVFCPLVGNESTACQDLHKQNKEKCDKIWLGMLE